MSSVGVCILRRTFLQSLGLSGLGLGLGLGLGRDAKAGESTEFRPNVFLHIAPDGIVTIACKRSEMGQGVRSSLPVLIADELGADMARVKVVQADGDERYGSQDTDGSSSVRDDFELLRRAGATARTMLVAVAAHRWGVAPASCSASDHQVKHAPSKRALGFGELVADAAKLKVPGDGLVALRPRGELRHLGKRLPLLDGPDIVTGRAIFAADVKLPGMLVAVIARPPVVGGKVASHDDRAALAVSGVRRVVELPAPKPPFAFQPLGGLAVLADDTWAALRGRAALEIKWDAGDNGAYDSDAYRRELDASIAAPGHALRKIGDVDKALALAHRRVEAVYHLPHLAHAPMEPEAALARVDGDRCEIWSCTQSPQGVQEAVGEALGIPQAHVTSHVTLLGGAFGRKAKPDFEVEAALLARAAGVPVRVQWTREDDIQHGYYHTVSAQRFVAGLDAYDRITAWHHRTAFPPIGSTFSGAKLGSAGDLEQGVLDLPLAIPNVRAEVCEAVAHVRIGWLRSVSNIFHAFAAQSFIDELAHERRLDPRENLLSIIGPARTLGPEQLGVAKLGNYGHSLAQHPLDTGRHRRVIERVTELARWADRKKEGRALGLAVHRSFVTYVAVVMSVVRDKERIRVDEAYIVADAGTVVNLDRVRAQLEGAVIFGMSLGLYGAITMKAGAVEQSNFRDYRLTRIAEAPRKIHVEVVASEGPPGGIGEPGVPPVAPALANAIFALTGTRVRDLPIARVLPV